LSAPAPFEIISLAEFFARYIDDNDDQVGTCIPSGDAFGWDEAVASGRYVEHWLEVRAQASRRG